MTNTATLQAKLAVLQARIARTSNCPDPTAKLSAHFHLGMVGGSGRNTVKLNRVREASLERTISNAVSHVEAVKEAQRVQAHIDRIENEPKRTAAKEMAETRMTERGRNAASVLKPGDMVRWIVSGTLLQVKRVNNNSVTVDMCGVSERLKFNEIEAA
jgi:hypothetical protein